jgi:hypothetical protein
MRTVAIATVAAEAHEVVEWEDDGI